MSRRAALILSLDFELDWGVRHAGRTVDADGTRRAVDALLTVFDAEDIAATWATVGFLFAADRQDRERHTPTTLPGYRDPALSPYADRTGNSEADDPARYALSLLRSIGDTPRQEIGSHTYSHYFALAPGQRREAFADDLGSAQRVASAHGFALRSLVFPKNQVNGAYLDLLPTHGFTCYRGRERGWRHAGDALPQRAARLWQSYAGDAAALTAPWASVRAPSVAGPVNVPGTAFLRPARPSAPLLDTLRIRRLQDALRLAAARNRFVHVWWHPHNFAAHLSKNMSDLRAVIRTVSELRDRGLIDSLTMAEAAARAPAEPGASSC